jgi:hypothetical protein
MTFAAILSRPLVVSVFASLAACATDAMPEMGAPGSDPEMGSDSDPVPSCVPSTCAELGLSCGSAFDGCGAQLDCGTCDTTTTGGGTCVPRTCTGKCGAIDDGCGHQIDCGGCDTGYACQGQSCVATSCAQVGLDQNACSGCGDLPIEPGAACPCGTVASCNAYGQVRCEPSHIITLPATTDSDDNWKVANGTISVIVHDGDNHTYDAPMDYWSVKADDTIWGVMEPQLQFHGPSNVRLKVCFRASAGNYDVSFPVDCGPGTSLGGCCAIKEIGQTDVSLALRINWGLPTVTNDDVAAMFDVTTYEVAEPTAACAQYTLRYRF